MKTSPESGLPVAWVPPARRLHALPREAETVFYARRPGLGALPEGGGALAGFGLLQLLPTVTLFWAVWWPAPTTRAGMVFAVGCTLLMAALSGTVLWLLVRPRLRAVRQFLVMPFVRLTVTDRRVTWTLPWRAAPLFEIGRERVLGGLLGVRGSRGWAPAAIMLEPGDPAGDEDGFIHFDRLPDAEGFVEALARTG